MKTIRTSSLSTLLGCRGRIVSDRKYSAGTTRWGTDPHNRWIACWLFWVHFRSWLDRQTYVAAVKLRSLCRIKGVEAGPIDFLIASACCQYGFPLLTADKDFLRIASHCDLIVLPD